MTVTRRVSKSVLGRGRIVLIGAIMAFLAAGCGAGPGKTDSSPAPALRPASWKKLSTAPTRRTEVTAAAVGNRIFVAGGFAPDGSTVTDVEIFNVAGGDFTAGPSLPRPANHAMSAALDGTFYVMGGYSDGLSNPTAAAFALKDGKWDVLPQMPEARAAGGAAAVAGKIFVTGGVGADGLSQSTVVYDPPSRTWTESEGLPTRREHLGVASSGDRLFAVGGRAPANLAAVEALDTTTLKWSRLPSLPTARGGLAAAATANGFVVAPGGEQASGTFAEVEAFDVKKGRWITLPPLPTPRHGLGVAAVGTTVYVISGGPQPGFAFSGANESLDLRDL